MPKIVDHDRRRREIAVLTLDVMRAVGIENASIRSIAQRGGISMGVLTHYFKTKDDLVVFTFRWLADQSYGQLDKAIENCKPGLDSLETAIEAMFPKAREEAALSLWMSLWDRAVRNPRFAREHRDYYRRWRQYIKRFLTEAVKLKQVPRNLNIGTATDLIVAAADGLWLAMTLEPRRFSKAQKRILLKKLIGDLTQRTPAWAPASIADNAI
jgi:AcrR family transcriptional regulator